jgi:hypothetical protein
MPSARGKSWRGTLEAPTDAMLEDLRTQARESNLHMALNLHRQGATVSSAEVLIVFREARRARADSFPLPTWSSINFESEWPVIRRLWKDEAGAEFFPSSCRCHLCKDESTSSEPPPRKKRRKVESSMAASAAEAEYLREQLAVAEARWARALPVLQSLLAPEALQLIIGNHGHLALPVAHAHPVPP